jgi:ABC-type transport system involved in multi-copper enzyme maturation permease subunit
MRNVLSIAANVVKDASRRKIFYVVFLFGLVVLAVSPLLPSFELGATASFLKDISISLTSLFGVVLAVILAVTQIPGEIEKRTIYNILSKPVGRAQYLLGKYLGILISLFGIMFVMSIEILILLGAKTSTFSPVILQGVFAVFLEAAIISAFCLMLTTFTSIPITAFAAILFYFLCHIKTGFLHQKLVTGTTGIVKVLAGAVYYAIPNLENFNISQQVAYGGGASATYMLRITGYAILFAAVFIVIAHAAFRRKDL